MLRITPLDHDLADGPATLRLEGRLDISGLDEFAGACREVLGGPRPLRLDLAGVTFMDDAAVTLVQAFAAQQVVIVGCSAFVAELLRRRRNGAPAPDDEAGLIALLRSGDTQAFESVVRTNMPRMLAVARRMLRNDEDAADAVQDAFVSAFRSLDRFEGSSKLATWLHRITVNAALMKLRRKASRDEVSIEALLPTFMADGHREDPRPAWTEPTESLLERDEMRAMIRARIDELPDDYRTILILRDIEELDTDATAEALGITPGAVKTRLHRARMALRTLLEREFASRASA